ncbi:16S rRNA (guanine(527)-N(7))-methyltransferase RsmG [Rickettsiales bacterium]|nr:16S rRNA (guanine(527)-N(7))-methyltransferase RsmG [Rickettsiales bacterium]
MKSIGEQRNLFKRKANVSCETMKMFDQYHDFLQEEQKNINLIGPGTLDKIWVRHFLDSAFLVNILVNLNFRDLSKKKCISLLDVGSGAGFPGIVLAILFNQKKVAINVFLAESNQKKASFLKRLVSLLRLKVTIIPNRVELLRGKKFDFIVSRAVAPLDKLFSIVFPINSIKSSMIFYKGKNWREEYEIIKKKWKLKSLIVKKNEYDEESDGVVLIIKGLSLQRNKT